MGQRPVEQADARVLFPLQSMAQQMRDTADAQRADGVDKERMAAVKGVDVAQAVLEAGPAGGLHGSTRFQRQLIEVELPFVGGNAALEHQTAQIAIGGDVVEAVIVHSDVSQVFRHVTDDMPPGRGELILIAGHIEAEQGVAVLKSLRPLGPVARGIAPGEGDDGSAITGLPAPVKTQGFFCSKSQCTFDSRHKVPCAQGLIGFHSMSF